MINQKIKIIWMYIRWPYDRVVLEIKYRKKLKELREKDPYVYE